MNYDVIVIGAGLSGLMAAEAAQSEGARVLVLARGMGSLSLTTSCIDGLGYSEKSQDPISSPLASIAQWRKNYPLHPYSLLGAERIIASLTHFQEVCRRGGLDYQGDFSSTMILPTALGTFRPTCLAPEAMKRGDLSLPGPVLLLGIKGYREFFPFFAAENLNALHEDGKASSSFRGAVVEEFHIPGKVLNSLSLAQALDEKKYRDLLVTRVKSLLKIGERLGFPAVLGFHDSQDCWRDMQEKLGTEVFEIPIAPPSVPGLRLDNCLKHHLREKGVRVIVGLSELTPIRGSGELSGFSLGRPGTHVTYYAKAVVLATGKFFGGGLDSSRARVFEPLLDLPLQFPSRRSEWFNPRLLGPGGQPFNSFGVEVDEDLRPVGLSGKFIYRNLFAAGGILAHADSVAEKSGGGVAISTGYWAGKMAAAVS